MCEILLTSFEIFIGQPWYSRNIWKIRTTSLGISYWVWIALLGWKIGNWVRKLGGKSSLLYLPKKWKRLPFPYLGMHSMFKTLLRFQSQVENIKESKDFDQRSKTVIKKSYSFSILGPSISNWTRIILIRMLK